MFSELYVPYHIDLQCFNILPSLRVGWKWAISVMPYGEVWRERRRVFMQYFHPGNTDLHKATQVEFLRKMLPRLLENPENFLSITRQYVSQLPITVQPLKKCYWQCGWRDSRIPRIWSRHQGDR